MATREIPPGAWEVQATCRPQGQDRASRDVGEARMTEETGRRRRAPAEYPRRVAGWVYSPHWSSATFPRRTQTVSKNWCVAPTKGGGSAFLCLRSVL